MNDLISRQALLDQLESYDGNKVTDSSGKPYIPWWKALEAIEKAPTAYDVNKVLERLEEWQKHSQDGLISVEYVIALLKGAIKDETDTTI